MGRPLQPTAIADAKGYFEKHPERARPNEPHPSRPLGGPPKEFTDAQKKLWKEIKGMLPPGVAFYSDRIMFEMMVLLWEKHRSGTITEAGANRLMNLAARFGMTPADRAKIQVQAEPQSKLAKFLNKKPKAAPVVVPPVETSVQ